MTVCVRCRGLHLNWHTMGGTHFSLTKKAMDNVVSVMFNIHELVLEREVELSNHISN